MFYYVLPSRLLWVCLLKSVRCVRHQDIPAGQGADCDLVSMQSFPWNTCNLTWLCPADRIQERITHKERSTSHFTLEEVGWFSDMAASRLPEYSSLVVSRVNGKVIGDVTGIFCHSVTCLGTNQCCWDGNPVPGWFMNVPQYLLVNVQLVIWFQSSLSHETLATWRGCALQIASKKGLHTRKGARLTSHVKKLGGSLTWLLQDCLSIPHLSWAQSTERRLPMLEASSATVSHASGQSNAAGMGIICQGDSWMFHSTCLERCAEKSGFQRAFPICTCNLHVDVPCRLHPRNSLTQERKNFSLHTWRSWVILWHVCFKTAWILHTCGK